MGGATAGAATPSRRACGPWLPSAGMKIAVDLTSCQGDARCAYLAPGRVPTTVPGRLAGRVGVHHCFGAPLARLEGQIVLAEFARRVQNPRLVEDPPPYRPSPVLGGPIHLKVDIDGISG